MGKQFNSSSLNSNMKFVIAFVTLAIAMAAADAYYGYGGYGGYGGGYGGYGYGGYGGYGGYRGKREAEASPAPYYGGYGGYGYGGYRESVKLKLPQLHTMADMEVMV